MYLQSLTSHVIFRFHIKDLESCLLYSTHFSLYSWFGKWQWLHYDVAKDAVRCFTCCKAVKDERTKTTGQAEGSFLVNGFTNWKDVTTMFANHESSDFHKLCAEALSSTVDIGDMLNKQAMTKKQTNRVFWHSTV